MKNNFQNNYKNGVPDFQHCLSKGIKFVTVQLRPTSSSTPAKVLNYLLNINGKNYLPLQEFQGTFAKYKLTEKFPASQIVWKLSEGIVKLIQNFLPNFEPFFVASSREVDNFIFVFGVYSFDKDKLKILQTQMLVKSLSKCLSVEEGFKSFDLGDQPMIKKISMMPPLKQEKEENFEKNQKKNTFLEIPDSDESEEEKQKIIKKSVDSLKESILVKKNIVISESSQEDSDDEIILKNNDDINLDNDNNIKSIDNDKKKQKIITQINKFDNDYDDQFCGDINQDYGNYIPSDDESSVSILTIEEETWGKIWEDLPESEKINRKIEIDEDSKKLIEEAGFNAYQIVQVWQDAEIRRKIFDQLSGKQKKISTIKELLNSKLETLKEKMDNKDHLLKQIRRKKKIRKEKFINYVKVLEDLFKKRKFFKQIYKWIQQELFKSENQKKQSVLNKTLLLFGDTGVGKTTFFKKIIDPYFKGGSLFLDNAYQPSHSVKDDVRVYYSPDDAKINSLYSYSLVANQEFPINVKYSPHLTNQTTNSVVILTNHPINKIKGKLEKIYWRRLKRRLIIGEITIENFYQYFLGDTLAHNGEIYSSEEIAWSFWVWCLHSYKVKNREEKKIIELNELKKSVPDEYL